MSTDYKEQINTIYWCCQFPELWMVKKGGHAVKSMETKMAWLQIKEISTAIQWNMLFSVQLVDIYKNAYLRADIIHQVSKITTTHTNTVLLCYTNDKFFSFLKCRRSKQQPCCKLQEFQQTNYMQTWRDIYRQREKLIRRMPPWSPLRWITANKLLTISQLGGCYHHPTSFIMVL